MMTCPHCRTRMIRTGNPGSTVFRCRSCGGHAIEWKNLPSVAGPGWARSLKERAEVSGKWGVACPGCGLPSVEVKVPVPAGEIEVDFCGGCSTLWLDPRELVRLPSPPRPWNPEASDPTAGALRHALGEAIARDIADSSPGRSGFGTSPPIDGWRWIPALLGLPVEGEGSSLGDRPWVTWGIGAAMVAVFLVSLADPEGFIRALGMVPAKALRYGGLTFLTGFLLHAGWVHLLGNLYFLLVFGDDVEDALGRARFALLVAAAAMAGHLLHIGLDPHATIPCVGASGGIAGVLAFYALRFPRRRLAFLWYWRFWVHIPAWFAMALWVGLQILTAFQQRAGTTNVSGLAHLGGALAGLAAWAAWRKARPAVKAGA